MFAKISEGVDSWVERFRQDMLPYRGRMSSTLRIVLAVIITLVALLILQMPFASLGLYLVFIVGRDSPSVSLRSSIFAWVAVAMSIAIELAVVIASDNDPVARLLSVSAVTFVAGMLMAATTVPGASIFGFVYCIGIALWENHGPANSMVNLSLRLVGTVAVPLGVSVAVEYVFGDRHPADSLEVMRRDRWQALEKMFTLYGQGADPKEVRDAYIRVSRLAVVGQSEMQRVYNTIVDRNLDTGSLPIGARVRITMLAQLMDVSAAFGSQNREPLSVELRRRCARIAHLCHELVPNWVPKPEEQDEIEVGHTVDTGLLDRVEDTLHAILQMPANTGAEKDKELIALPSREVPILIPGALTSLDTVAFALKISLCSTLCYIIYHAVAWPGISTSVTTVLITGLSTTGAIKQKLVFRVLGSAIGGLLLGLGATAFVFPYIDSLTPFVIVVVVVTFFAAWVATGPKFGYIGLQIAFAFYLVALEESRASTELAPARDRLIGILLALVIMSFVFDQLWPVRTVTAMRRALASVLRSEAGLFRLIVTSTSQDDMVEHADVLRDRVGKTIQGLRTMNDTVDYEFGVDRQLHKRVSEAILKAGLTAVALFWNQLAVVHRVTDRDFVTQPDLMEMLRKLADHMDEMADAVAKNQQPVTVPAASFVNASLLTSQRYGEYTRNTIARYDELQATVCSLGVEI